jgi:hypothetical protein
MPHRFSVCSRPRDGVVLEPGNQSNRDHYFVSAADSLGFYPKDTHASMMTAPTALTISRLGHDDTVKKWLILTLPGRDFSDEQRRAFCLHKAVQLASGAGRIRRVCGAGANWIDLAHLCGRVVVAGPAAKRKWLMSVANVKVGKSVQKKPMRRVSIRPDGEDFVIVSLAEDVVVYRNRDPSALRKLCHSLRWEIAIDSSQCRCPLGVSPKRIA